MRAAQFNIFKETIERSKSEQTEKQKAKASHLLQCVERKSDRQVKVSFYSRQSRAI